MLSRSANAFSSKIVGATFADGKLLPGVLLLPGRKDIHATCTYMMGITLPVVPIMYTHMRVLLLLPLLSLLLLFVIIATIAVAGL
jgi:hypothetical protein